MPEKSPPVDFLAETLAKRRGEPYPPGNASKPVSTAPGTRATRACPFCAEDILAAAVKCKHCGSDVSMHPAAPMPAPQAATEGTCPNCQTAVALDSARCNACGADFGSGSAWTVLPRAARIAPDFGLDPTRLAALRGLAPVGSSTFDPPAKGGGALKVLGYVVLGVIGVFVLLLVIGSNMPPQTSQYYDKKRAAEEMCDQMISDSALGDERRMNRKMCDDLKAMIEKERPR